MSYQHILVAVDLSKESQFLLKKAANLAKCCNAKLSMIHVGLNYSDLYSDLLDLSVAKIHQDDPDQSHSALQKIAENSEYPVTHLFSGNGEFIKIVEETVEKYKVDLIVCGHYNDFWSNLMSSAKQVIKLDNVDTLIIPLKSE